MVSTGCVFLLSIVLGSCPSSFSKNKDLQSVCGRPILDRIVGGQNAVAGHWPWQVSLHIGPIYMCGGSLISDRWIVTAAHCIKVTWIPYLYTVWLGSITIHYSDKNVIHHVSQIVFHPKSPSITADIVLLKLDSRVTFTSFILPICLPNTTKQLKIPGSCWVTGWGQTDKNTDTHDPPTLQEAEVPIIDRQTCEYFYNPISLLLPGIEPVIKEDMICAARSYGDFSSWHWNPELGCLVWDGDPCSSGRIFTAEGDSGGPLTCHIDDVWTLIGIVSWGLECGKTPGVYTNATYYKKWIKATISRAEVWGPTIWTYLTYCSLFYCYLWLSWDTPVPLGLTSYQESRQQSLKPLAKYIQI